jgi:hypothetical protein
LLQGPFVDGTVSAFMDYVRSTPVDIDVYLCGWNSGFAKVFSILESLKVFYKIRFCKSEKREKRTAERGRRTASSFMGYV